MADSILERLIDNRIAALKTILVANGREEDVGRVVYDGRKMNFQEPPPFAFWALDEDIIDPRSPLGRDAYILDFWVGAGIDYGATEDSWRKLARVRSDLHEVMGPNFPLLVPVQAGGEAAIQVQVRRQGSNSPVLETANGSKGFVEILYKLSFDTKRNAPGVH